MMDFDIYNDSKIESIVFPELKPGEEIMLCYGSGAIYYALVDKGDYIKIYSWDGIAAVWNTCRIYEKVALKHGGENAS